MTLHRLLRLAPLAVLFAGVASAQTTGTVIGVVSDQSTGKPVVGALVVATSPLLQGEQTAVTDKNGSFRIQSLPSGDYKLSAQFEGYKPYERNDIRVSIDKTIRANLALVPEAVQLEEQVVKTGAASPVINLGSAESGAVISKEFLSNLPTSRGFQNVAAVAPGAQIDTYGISFAGASSPENNYILDGMNVGDPAYGVLGSQILNNFVQEIDVKTGSFNAEYGFSTGGIINVVTKSGSNEFHGSVFANYNPGQLRGTPKAVGRDAEAISIRNNPADGSYNTDFGFEVGGPIIKDRLWFYVGFAPQLVRNKQERFLTATSFDQTTGNVLRSSTGQAIGTEIPGSVRKFNDDTKGFQLTSKLTYLFNENNNIALSFITSPSTRNYLAGANGQASWGWAELQDDFTDVIARYSSKLLDKKLLVELNAGWHHQAQETKPTTFDGVDQKNTPETLWLPTEPLSWFEAVDTSAGAPCAIQTTAAGARNPCQVTNYSSGGIGFFDKLTMDRFSGKASATYLADFFGSHTVKGGGEVQVTSYDHTKAYSGSRLMRARTASALGVDGGPDDIVLQDFRQYGFPINGGATVNDAVVQTNTTVKSTSTSQAYYLQDSYSPIDGLTVNAGFRAELQQMGVKDLPGSQELKINDNYGPRLQAIYDFTKQGRSKVSASWGRFFQAIPLDMADRAFGDERQVRDYRNYCNPVSGITNKSAVSIATALNNCQVIPDFYDVGQTYLKVGTASTPVNPGLKGQFVDQFGAGVEYEVLTDLSLGFDYQGRRLGRVIEDMSNDDGNNYAIANPGEGKAWDLYGDGSVIFDPVTATSQDPVTGRIFHPTFPKPKREYDGFTFSVKKNYSNHWQALVSYTYSSFRGNYPGLYRPETAQLDPNLTSEYDLTSLLANREGPLPGDIPHQLKAFGSYTWDINSRFNVTAGAAVNAKSGTPINYLGAHPDYGPGEGFVLPRGSAGRTPFNTTVDVKAQLGYTISPPYAVKVFTDIFNLFNSQEHVNVDQNWTFDSIQPIQNGVCKSRNGAEGTNPIAGAFADCPSLNYLQTTSGRPATLNKNFGRPSNAALINAYLAPIAFRFGLEVSF
jgi:hypothetical protein